jgi:predicted kinase
MSYYVILRGPLGVGKTTVSRRLSGVIRAEYISIDRILDEHGLWRSGRLSEFLRANEVAGGRARNGLAQGIPVVFDGNFYWKSQIKDLIGRLEYPRYVFTLKAPLAVCIERDRRRPGPHGAQGASEVYAKSTKFEYGIGVDATGSVEDIVQEIVSYVSAHRVPASR